MTSAPTAIYKLYTYCQKSEFIVVYLICSCTCLMSFLFLQTNKKGTSEGQKVRISCVNFCIQILKGRTSAIAIAEVIDHPVKDGPLTFRQNETALPSDAQYNE